jgi:hypothetical protein
VSETPGPDEGGERTRSRGLDLLTAVLLGVVSVTTALGAWQASTWSRQADDYGESSSDARDAAIIRGVDWQYDNRLDTAAILNARKHAVLSDEAVAANDPVGVAYNEVMVGNYLNRIVSDDTIVEEFAAWREQGFPVDGNPLTQPTYQVSLRGEADSYILVSTLAGGFKSAYEAKANIFTQAALIDALALFLLGVAGINRLRSARFATLALGAVAYLLSLFMMATAY